MSALKLVISLSVKAFPNVCFVRNVNQAPASMRLSILLRCTSYGACTAVVWHLLIPDLREVVNTWRGYCILDTGQHRHPQRSSGIRTVWQLIDVSKNAEHFQEALHVYLTMTAGKQSFVTNRKTNCCTSWSENSSSYWRFQKMGSSERYICGTCRYG